MTWVLRYSSISFLYQGVCCGDHIHCCPSGYTCDVQAQLCHKGSISIPLLTKMPSIVKSEALDVQCDETVKCQSGSTCCKLTSGSWACCPLLQVSCHCLVIFLCAICVNACVFIHAILPWCFTCGWCINFCMHAHCPFCISFHLYSLERSRGNRLFGPPSPRGPAIPVHQHYLKH